MDHCPLELSAAPRRPLRNTATSSHCRALDGPETRATPMRLLLAHRHGLWGQGLAALLATQPNIEFLAQVPDGETAWAAIRTQAPDLALLDLNLTGASGIEVVRRVRAAALSTRCVMLATRPDPALASRAMHAGAAGYLLKDCAFEELMLALRRIDASETYLSPSIAAGLPGAPDRGQDPALLTCREQEIMRLVAGGHSSKTIARALGLSHHTVDTHRRRLMKKLGLHSAAEVVRHAVQHGLLI